MSFEPFSQCGIVLEIGQIAGLFELILAATQEIGDAHTDQFGMA